MGSHIVINKITKFKNYIIKLAGYRFEKSGKNQLGLKYTFVLIKDNVRILGYDNHERKGHHKHAYNKESKYNFKGVDKLLDDFHKDLEEMIGKNEG